VFIPALKADMYLLWPRELIKGTSAKEARRGGTKKLSSFLFLGGFYTIFYFTEFCITRYFNFFNSVLIKNVEMDSSFFYNFLFQIFKNFKFDQPIFQSMR
jgi:hypothetical protein